MLGVASALLLGFSFGCTGTTNDPTVAGAGTPVTGAPKDMNEWAQQNKMMNPAKKGGAKSAPGPAAAK
jgi:hypothetical protein